jgi:hypothetical protein
MAPAIAIPIAEPVLRPCLDPVFVGVGLGVAGWDALEELVLEVLVWVSADVEECELVDVSLLVCSGDENQSCRTHLLSRDKLTDVSPLEVVVCWEV